MSTPSNPEPIDLQLSLRQLQTLCEGEPVMFSIGGQLVGLVHNDRPGADRLAWARGAVRVLPLDGEDLARALALERVRVEPAAPPAAPPDFPIPSRRPEPASRGREIDRAAWTAWIVAAGCSPVLIGTLVRWADPSKEERVFMGLSLFASAGIAVAWGAWLDRRVTPMSLRLLAAVLFWLASTLAWPVGWSLAEHGVRGLPSLMRHEEMWLMGSVLASLPSFALVGDFDTGR